MEMNFRIWDAYAGKRSGFSAHLVRLLGEINKLETHDQVHSKGLPIWIDWVKWPVPSMTHPYSLNYYEGDKLPFVNSWEYYFHNPVDTTWALHSMEENPASWKTTDGLYTGWPAAQEKVFKERTSTYEMCNFTNTYFKPKDDILDLLDIDIIKYKTLGVHCRRSDMVREHNNIGMAYSDEDFFRKVMKVFTDNGFEKIYLATEEIAIYVYFMQRIPELILCQHDCYRIEQSFSPVDSLALNPRPLHRYLMGKEILIDILNLSRCNSLLCSVSGVSNISTYFNNLKYNDVFYFDEL